MRNLSTVVGALALVVACVALANPSVADSVYLKNGRVLHSSVVRVEGDRVIVKQYDGLVIFPQHLVERIEENNRVEPGGYVPPQPEVPFEEVQQVEGNVAAGDEEAGGAAREEGAAQPEEGQAAEDPEAQPDTPEQDPRRDRAYWQGRLRPIFTELDRAERERRQYEDLAQTSAEAQRQLDRIDRAIADLESQAEAIRSEATRLGVPPGWLRR